MNMEAYYQSNQPMANMNFFAQGPVPDPQAHQPQVPHAQVPHPPVSHLQVPHPPISRPPMQITEVKPGDKLEDEDGNKLACGPCIRGHRATSCTHIRRCLLRVRKPGRPAQNCPHDVERCRECVPEELSYFYIRKDSGKCVCVPKDVQPKGACVRVGRSSVEQVQEDTRIDTVTRRPIQPVNPSTPQQTHGTAPTQNGYPYQALPMGNTGGSYSGPNAHYHHQGHPYYYQHPTHPGLQPIPYMHNDEAMSNGHSVHSDLAIPNGQAMYNDQAMPNGQAMHNGHAMPNSQAILNSHPVQNGQAIHNGQAMPSNQDLNNGQVMHNGQVMSSGQAMPHSQVMHGGQLVHNDQAMQSDQAMQNGHIGLNGQDMPYGSWMHNGTTVHNQHMQNGTHMTDGQQMQHNTQQNIPIRPSPYFPPEPKNEVVFSPQANGHDQIIVKQESVMELDHQADSAIPTANMMDAPSEDLVFEMNEDHPMSNVDTAHSFGNALGDERNDPIGEPCYNPQCLPNINSVTKSEDSEGATSGPACGCGPGCNCFACRTHPTNPRTVQEVTELNDIMVHETTWEQYNGEGSGSMTDQNAQSVEQDEDVSQGPIVQYERFAVNLDHFTGSDIPVLTEEQMEQFNQFFNNDAVFLDEGLTTGGVSVNGATPDLTPTGTTPDDIAAPIRHATPPPVPGPCCR